MKQLMVALCALVVSASELVADALPKEGRYDSRVRTVEYNPDEVFNIAGQLLNTTTIEFAADETIVMAGVGDPVWEVAPNGNLLFLKPRERHPRTNLNVVTVRGEKQERRTYVFALVVMPPTNAASRELSFWLVRFRYPTDEERKRKQEQAARAVADKAAAAEKTLAYDEKNGPKNWSYSVQGEADFEPTAVWDNGKVTTILFKGNVEMPAIYIEANGKEELVPKHVTGGRVTVHALARKLVLRRGDTVLCLFNEKYVAEGIDTLTKTTSPRVERVVTGAGKPVSPFGPPVVHPSPFPASTTGPAVPTVRSR